MLGIRKKTATGYNMKCPKCRNLMQYVFRVDDKFFYCYKCEIRKEGLPPKIKAEDYKTREVDWSKY
jgi:hypothetical protein